MITGLHIDTVKGLGVIIPDQHIPYNNPETWECILGIIEQLEPAWVVILGDYADFACLSRHIKFPDKALSLELEVAKVRECLEDLSKILSKGCQKYFVTGNHEDRLDKYVATNADKLWGMVTTNKLLGLDELGWKEIPYREGLLLNNNCLYTHDIDGRSGKSALFKASDVTREYSVVIGHVHRVGCQIIGDYWGRPHEAWSFGWGGNRHACSKYKHSFSQASEWCQALGIAWAEPDRISHFAVTIHEGKALYPDGFSFLS